MFLMGTIEDIRHDLLLTIVIATVILFSTGLGDSKATPSEPVIIP
ncbi:MAG: hypothetical protein ACOX0T_03795 [Pelotomaculum sp.]